MLKWFFCFVVFIIQVEANPSYLLNRPFSWDIERDLPIKKESDEIKICFWNIQIQWMDQKQPEKYAWKNRRKPVIELIKRDKPDVLGLCEYNLQQADDLREALLQDSYVLVGYSSETRKTLDEVASLVDRNPRLAYGEFVGFLYNSQRCSLINIHCHPLKRGKKHARILVEGCFLDHATRTYFTVLVSHFDHLCEESRAASASLELSFIKALEEEHVPWFSLGDRNWYPDEFGQKAAETYVERSYICDFRDETEEGTFGPSGTFVGFLGLESNVTRPIIEWKNRNKAVLATTVDVCFRSRSLVGARNYYTYKAEFDPDSYALIPENESGDVNQRNFASDHYYIGGIFRLLTLCKNAP